MRNLWGKISKASSVGSQGQQTAIQQSEPKPIVIDYFQIRQIEQQIVKFNGIDLFQFPNSKIACTFQEVMKVLHSLLDILSQVKHEAEKNNQKLNQYDRLKNLVSQHSEIVKHIQQQSSQNLNRLYEDKRKVQKEGQEKIQKLNIKLNEQERQLNKLNRQLQQKKSQNQSLKYLLSEKNAEIERLSERQDLYNKKLNQILAVDDSSIKFNSKGYNLGDIVDIQTILVYSKLRKQIYSFLSAQDFINLWLTNKHIYYICSKTLKKQYIGIMMANKNAQIQKFKKDKKESQRIFDSFPAENIRTNAIKYLFFKIKPGGYMLPYFQDCEETHTQKIQQKSKLSQISNFFKKKNQSQITKQKILTFESLKNDNDFKQIQKRVQLFFDKMFGIQAHQDLKFFNETMKRQLSELKTQLKGNQKSLQLLCMSRFLYLEMNELNNLLQVCFALLLNKHNDLKQLKKKNEDLIENDRVLRNLVESIANDREEVEKRIFYLQNQNLKTKHSQQIIQQELKKTRQSEMSKKEENERLLMEIKDLIQRVEEYERQNKSNKIKWEQISQLMEEIKIEDQK